MVQSELQDFAAEIQTGKGARPNWLTNLGYLLVLVGLGYFISTTGDGGLEGPNPVFWGLLAFWLVYTPFAMRRKWFMIML